MRATWPNGVDGWRRTFKDWLVQEGSVKLSVFVVICGLNFEDLDIKEQTSYLDCSAYSWDIDPQPRIDFPFFDENRLYKLASTLRQEH